MRLRAGHVGAHYSCGPKLDARTSPAVAPNHPSPGASFGPVSPCLVRGLESGLAIVKNGSQSIDGQLRLRLSLLHYYDFFYF